MAEVVTVAATKVRGLVAINCEGQTRDYRYLPAPFLLMADLHRAGLNLRKPVAFHRVGIPGSGGPDWLRNDWEPVVCVTRPGRLPWSDPTACGEAPKFRPGGPPSHRMTNGSRVGTEVRRGKAAASGKRYDVTGSRRNPDGSRDLQLYVSPDVANPGNVVSCAVGGGRMGHPLAHESEAPFPLALAEFFVRSFCPPGGLCIDPFVGSGTTAHAAFLHGRRFVGCDVRQSQIDLTRRRLAGVTPDLFAQEDA
jgi:hypothetical protein